MSVIRHFLLILFAICSVNALLSQHPLMRHYTVDDGLPSSHVYYVHIDKEGFAWICTDQGLARFNGYTFEVLTVEDGLPSNDIWGVVEDNEGRLWLETFDKVAYYQDGQIYRLPDLPEFVETSTIIHSIDSFGNHLLRASNLSYKVTWKGEEIQYEKLDSMYALLTGSYIAAQDQIKEYGLNVDFSKVDTTRRYFYTQGNLVNVDLDVIDMMRNKSPRTTTTEPLIMTQFSLEDKLYIIARDSVFAYHKDLKFGISVHDILPEANKIVVAERLGNSMMYVKTDKGTRFLNAELELLSNYNFLGNLELNELNEDRHGNLWIGTPYGLYFISANATKAKFIASSDIYANTYMSLAVDTNGKYWLGNDQGHLYQWTGQELFEYNVPTLLGSKITDIYISNDQLMVGGNFLYSFDKDYLNTLPTQQLGDHQPEVSVFLSRTRSIVRKRAPISVVKSIWTRDDKTYFISTGTGVYIIEPDGSADILQGVRSYSAIRDTTEDILYLGMKLGLRELRDSQIFQISHIDTLLDRPVNYLQLDNKNRLWVGTDGFGLYCYDKNVSTPISEFDYISIKTIFLGADNDLWIGTNQGIYHLILTQDDLSEYEIETFTTTHGLISNEINDIVVRSDTLYAATQNGLSIVDLKEVDRMVEPPTLRLTNIDINGEPVELNSTYDLTYSDNNLSIAYVCLSFKSNGHIDYFYKMEGAEETWYSTKSLRRDYLNLRPGTYTFYLKARDIDGFETELKAPLKFVIHPPWWDTTWFKILVVLAIIAAILGYLSWRINRVRREAERENKINKKFAELELKALQAQMNPHFVFNALHAIQDYVFQKDARTANRYIVKFSRLMRLFLESSKEKYIILSDEISMLNLYVEMEQLRFEGLFDFELNLASDIEANNIEIPSMLLQPFLENAINHGLVHKKGEEKGKLTVDVFTIEDRQMLKCVIADNGIGRQRAAQIREKSFKSYKSRGMQIVEERQKILNYIEGSEIEIQIIDLKNMDGEAIGTRVEICIPL